MPAIEGSLARKLDFGVAPAKVTSTDGRGRAHLRLAPGLTRLPGPDKYSVLQQRRRRAQINARHLLDLPEQRD